MSQKPLELEEEFVLLDEPIVLKQTTYLYKKLTNEELFKEGQRFLELQKEVDLCST